jgi:hypothetical protein
MNGYFQLHLNDDGVSLELARIFGYGRSPLRGNGD